MANSLMEIESERLNDEQGTHSASTDKLLVAAEQAVEDFKRYLDGLEQKLRNSVPRVPELMPLFRELVAQIYMVYRDGLFECRFVEYAAHSDEDLIAWAIYLTQLGKSIGLQRRGWIGVEYGRWDRGFFVDVFPEDLVDLYLAAGRDIDTVICFLSVTFSGAIARGVLARRLERFPIGEEVGLALLHCLRHSDEPTLKRLLTALKVERIKGRHPIPDEAERDAEDFQAIALKKAWELYRESGSRNGAAWHGEVKAPVGFEDEDLAEGWGYIAQSLQPLVRLAQEQLLPILRGETERYPKQAYQAVRDYWRKRLAQKRGGPEPLEIPHAPECPVCHQGHGVPQRPMNPDPRVTRLWPFVCDTCKVAFEGRPDIPPRTVRLHPEVEVGPPPQTLATWQQALTINPHYREPDAEPALERSVEEAEAHELDCPRDRRWKAVQERELDFPWAGRSDLPARMRALYQLAQQCQGDRGLRFVDAFLECGTITGAAQAVGFSRQTAHGWLARLRKGAMQESPMP